MKLKPESKFWDVRLSYVSGTRKYVNEGKEFAFPIVTNVHLMVAAESAAKVVELTMAEHPNANIHQINHRGGECAIIVQPELLAKVE